MVETDEADGLVEGEVARGQGPVGLRVHQGHVPVRNAPGGEEQRAPLPHPEDPSGEVEVHVRAVVQDHVLPRIRPDEERTAGAPIRHQGDPVPHPQVRRTLLGPGPVDPGQQEGLSAPQPQLNVEDGVVRGNHDPDPDTRAQRVVHGIGLPGQRGEAAGAVDEALPGPVVHHHPGLRGQEHRLPVRAVHVPGAGRQAVADLHETVGEHQDAVVLGRGDPAVLHRRRGTGILDRVHHNINGHLRPRVLRRGTAATAAARDRERHDQNPDPTHPPTSPCLMR